MNITSTIITLGGIALSTAVCEKLANATGKMDIATYINVAGVSGAGLVAINLAVKLLGLLKGI